MSRPLSLSGTGATAGRPAHGRLGAAIPEFAMLFFIKVDAQIRLAGPVQFDRQHFLVARVWRHKKPALVAQNILAGLNILGFADDRRVGGSAQPPSQRQREIMVGVNEVNSLRLQSSQNAPVWRVRSTISPDRRKSMATSRLAAASKSRGRHAAGWRNSGCRRRDLWWPRCSRPIGPRRRRRRHVHHGDGNRPGPERLISVDLAHVNLIAAAGMPSGVNHRDRSPGQRPVGDPRFRRSNSVARTQIHPLANRRTFQ